MRGKFENLISDQWLIRSKNAPHNFNCTTTSHLWILDIISFHHQTTHNIVPKLNATPPTSPFYIREARANFQGNLPQANSFSCHSVFIFSSSRITLEQ
jgi:hypothetical protein